MTDPIISLDGVSVRYGTNEAVKKASLDVEEGEFVALIGTNGAGKTTLLRSISGTVPYSGEIRYRGQSLAGASVDEIIRHGVVHVPQGRLLFPRLTVEENLRMGAHALEKDKVEPRLRELMELVPLLADRSNQRTRTMSGGEQQVVAVTRGLMAMPQFLVLDEPSLGLAPIMITRVMDIVRSEHESGATVLLAEQNIGVALKYADRIVVMRQGRIVADFARSEVDDEEELRRAYLGETTTGAPEP